MKRYKLTVPVSVGRKGGHRRHHRVSITVDEPAGLELDATVVFKPCQPPKYSVELHNHKAKDGKCPCFDFKRIIEGDPEKMGFTLSMGFDTHEALHHGTGSYTLTWQDQWGIIREWKGVFSRKYPVALEPL